MANEQNLTPFQKNREDTVKNARKGGKASGVAKRKKRTMQESLRFLMTMPMKQGSVDSLDDLGTIGKASKGANLVAGDELLVAMFKKARKGDVKAMELIMKWLGEDNVTNAVSPLDSLAKDIEKYKEMDDDGEED